MQRDLDNKVVFINCDISHMCLNYKKECDKCRENGGLCWEYRDECLSYLEEDE